MKPVPPLAARPAHPERVCWGCRKLCAEADRACGDDTARGLHPSELFGEDWLDFEAAKNGAGRNFLKKRGRA